MCATTLTKCVRVENKATIAAIEMMIRIQCIAAKNQNEQMITKAAEIKKIAKCLAIIIIALLASCKSNPDTSAKETKTNDMRAEIDSNDLAIYSTLMNKISTDSQYVTIIANECEYDSLSDDEIDVILAGGKASAINLEKMQNPQQSKVVPCKGYYIGIPNYMQVSRIIFSVDSFVDIIGRSSHDSIGATDFALLKFQNNEYAFSKEHICGSILIEYAKDKIWPHDILVSNDREKGWHLIK